MKRLQKNLGAADRRRMDTYLEDVREIERRIQRIEKYNASGEARALPAAPLGVPDSYEEHLKLMFDLQALAFMTDTTRVSAFKMSRDVSGRVWPESGVKTPFHPCSHHGENPARIAEFAKLNRYHVSLLPYFLQKLKNTPDGDGNLLDHSMVLYGSPMGDSNVHNHKRVPDGPGGPRQRRIEGQPARAHQGRHAHGQHPAHHAAQAGSGRGNLRRQQRGNRDLGGRYAASSDGRTAFRHAAERGFR